MASASPSVLQAVSLQKRYGSRTVVRDVSIEVSSGEVVGLLGPNGAGKTTSFYMIVGLVPLDGGDIRLNQKKISHLPIHQRARMGLSYLPQEASVFRKLNVAENIQAVLELQETNGKPLSKKQIQDGLDELLGELQISHLRNNPALSLSGGERRRVEIARALASSPKFILLDEPFAGVNPTLVEKLLEVLASMRKQHKITFLLIEHDLETVMNISERVIVMAEGKIIADGLPNSIYENEQVIDAYLGSRKRGA
ncbi:MAG: LPS export ABC transporter ATP-binding protein [Burkholderiaceae bacterium]|nr:LPS export ABC transporter ATP-binding protein [Burkholderiaceae bacterium]